MQRYIIIFGILALPTFLFFNLNNTTTISTLDPSPIKTTQLETSLPKEDPPQKNYQEIIKKVEKNSTIYSTLQSLGLTAQEIHRIILISKKEKIHLNRVQPGTRIKAQVGLGGWKHLSFDLSLKKTFTIERHNEELTAQLIHHPVTIHQQAFQGKVLSTLWESAIQSGVEGPLVMKLVNIFAWQVDFEREVRPGDSWKILIERQEIQGAHAGWGSILAAQYTNKNEEHMAFRYQIAENHYEYYDLNGDNLRGKFLKSPLRYSRISSKFHRKRFHPILKVNRPHYGVDYAAPTGTPVRAVGDGKVEIATYHRGSGNTVKIRHNSTYKTAYKHLQKFAKNLRKGRKVKQGDIIGYVGSTGLATGPHLHFEFYENGRYTDPLGRRFPKEAPIQKKLKPSFLLQAEKMQAALPPTPSQVAQIGSASSL
ncbi:MAG: peptidoglycan DD-metalloendopeptidase family protein [Oligoflexales bacterium]